MFNDANRAQAAVAPRLFCDICDAFDLHDTEGLTAYYYPFEVFSFGIFSKTLKKSKSNSLCTAGLPDAGDARPRGGRSGTHEGGRAARRGARILRVLRGVRPLR